uniref:Phospholipid/glycerol acyltransferase domain-containing protein n=1 Tax=Parascaris univalens TaxID=6257 RepID=A0A915BGR7_PARUN
MLASLLGVYVGFLLGVLLATICLILCGLSWGPLPHLYIRLITFLQNFYPHSYPTISEAPWPAIIRRCDASSLEKHRNDSLLSFKFSDASTKKLFEVCSNAFIAGFEAVVQDEISVAFDIAPSFHTTLLQWPGRLPFVDAPRVLSRLHVLGYLLALPFRYGVLLPIRFGLILTSFIYLFIGVIVSFFISLNKRQKTRICTTYCRLFSASLGLVARYHNPQYRPKQPGIAVSNHLSPNDIQIIHANVAMNADFGYTITGQKHNGIIWAIERLSERVCCALWFERNNAEERKRFTDILIKEGLREGPVLLFPEGYCTNNTGVLQFRRAVFQDGITIYPIAIRQNARFGDSFWSEKQFWRYLLRIITSWAIVYDVFYLEPQKKLKDEPAQMFAARVQSLIARAAGIKRVDYDGSLWYRKSEQMRMKDAQMKDLARHLKETTACNYSTDPTIIQSCDLIDHQKGCGSMPSSPNSTLLKTPLFSFAA